MNTMSTECGSGNCQCASGATPVLEDVASINGIALHLPGQQPDSATLREIAWAELLRQEAVRQGLLPRQAVLRAPALELADQQVIEALLDTVVPPITPTPEECRRYFDAHAAQYLQGRQVHARHILFAVTPGINVHALAIRAEQALLELCRRDVSPNRFAALARELSNCPTGADGGELGWFGPEECAEELANELFHQKNPLRGMGLHPRLVHSRYGFHIVEVLGVKRGRQTTFEEVQARIAVQLAQQSRARALHQYMQLLAGGARVEGVSLDAADSPLVQ